MTEKMIPVECKLADCVFYATQDTLPGQIFCKHAEKPHYLKALPCPLYRMDYQKKATGDPSAFLKMLRKGR